MLKKIFWFIIILSLLCATGVGSFLYYQIVVEAGDEIKPHNISKILGKESPVYYNDGKTPLGVFFNQAHRQYVPYQEIPVNFINGLVASEDNRFFSHFGFDLLGILRAMVKNVQSGRIVQGGSTLTQQTAENLFKIKGRSYKVKLKELLFALRLEYHYPKEKIFEFYANQFYVSGNGLGLGVAARYYFDKKPEELNLLQSAYIAGSVKRPNYYNPFIKKSQESRDKALQRGRTRVNYVLGKMLQLGMISQYQYDQAKTGDIGFKQGKVGFSLDYVMEMVRDAVGSKEVVEALEKAEISNIATSGVRIITTINQRMQENTLYALRHDLSRLDVRLRGYEREEVQAELEALDYKGDRTLKGKSFLFGKIETVEGSGKELRITVDLGRRLGRGVLDKEGIARLVKARIRWQKTPWTEVKKRDYTSFVEQLKVGDKVWVSIRDGDGFEEIMLDLEKYPKVNGGAVVLKDGVVLAVSGGVENRFYNRAIYAKRTMGSSFKPFVYAAAMQLGWNSTDLLKNSRELFIYQNQHYFPRPDHQSPFEWVSMSWAGVHSENVASVWLITHLCDKLNDEQFRDVAEYVGMAPKIVEGEEEPYSSFRVRIRDKFGIVITPGELRRSAFYLAQKDVETDLLFMGREVDFQVIKEMHYGLGFNRQLEKLNKELRSPSKKLKSSQRKELKLKREVMGNNYLALEILWNDFKKFRQKVELYRKYIDDPFGVDRERLNSLLADTQDSAKLYYDEINRRYFFSKDRNKVKYMRPITDSDLVVELQQAGTGMEENFWGNVTLDGKIASESFAILQKQVRVEMETLNNKLPYSMEVLQHNKDYRVLVGLRYLIALARELGVKSDLKPVLSFPLGSNVTTLLETLRIYGGLTTGKVVRTGKYKEDDEDLLSIIDRIETSEGEVIYQPTRKERKLLSQSTSMAIGHVMENIVKYGTGRYADKNIKLSMSNEGAGGKEKNSGLSIPVLGKTGTANRYTNASFFGFLPGLSENGDSMSMSSGYSVGVYVGYDDNKEMRKGATKISGSAGALPIWSEIVRGITREEKYGSGLDPVDLSFYGLTLKRAEEGQKNIRVAPERGGIVPELAREVSELNRYTPSILTFGAVSGSGTFLPKRQYQPFWKIAQEYEEEEND